MSVYQFEGLIGLGSADCICIHCFTSCITSKQQKTPEKKLIMIRVSLALGDLDPRVHEVESVWTAAVNGIWVSVVVPVRKIASDNTPKYCTTKTKIE